MLPKELEQSLPVVSKESSAINTVIALHACGFSPLAISANMNTSLETVNATIQRYGADVQPSPEFRAEFLSKFLESRIGDAILLMTPEKLQKMAPDKLINAIKQMGLALKELKSIPKAQESDVDKLLEAARNK